MSASSQSLEEKVTAKTLIWVAILSVAIAFFWNFFENFLPPLARCTQRVNALLTPIDFVGGPFVAFLAVMALQYFQPLRKRFTRTNLAYLSIVMITTSFYTHFATLETRNTCFLLARPLIPESVGRYVPWFVSLPSEVAELLIRGVGNLGVLPWDILFLAILWRFLLIALFAGVGISIVSIFRRSWIDVERLPFPYVDVVQTCLVNVEGMVKRNWPSKTRFLIGMLVGVLLGIPLSGATLFPWFPDLYMWRVDTCKVGSHWLAPADVPWHLGIGKHPLMYPIMLLTPTHALFSILFYTLVMEIALFISFYGFGYYTGMLGSGFCGRNWCTGPTVAPPLYLFMVCSGAALGFFVITIILERHYIMDTMKLAFRRVDVKVEAGEPMSYRCSWMMLLLFSILVMVFFMYTGLSPWLSFVVLLSTIIIWFTLTPMWGRTVITLQPCYWLSPAMIRLMAYPTQYLPEITSTDLIIVPLLSAEWIGHTAGGAYEGGGGLGTPFFVSASAYKIANLNNIHPRNALKVMVVSMLIASFITCFNQVAISGLFGHATLGYSLWDYSQEPEWHFWTIPYNGPIIEGWPHLVIGFILMVVGRYLYTRFLWMPDPLLALVAWSWEISIDGFWLACLVAWIVKSAILRIGGSRLYEEWVVPFVGGFTMGYALEILTTTSISFILFPRAL
jgi:hypothetical protein